MPDRWKGDYWANIPGLNTWIKNNHQFIDKYDGGKLLKSLKSLKSH